MTFVTNNKRTFDAERGYELHYIRSNKEGEYYFILKGVDEEYHFMAYYYMEVLSEVDVARIGHDFGGKYLIWCIGNWNERWKLLIADALLTYGIGHGAEGSDLKIFIRWGAGGAALDAEELQIQTARQI